MTLLAVPNISEGRDRAIVEAVAAAFGPTVLDVHTDPDHHRSVVTLHGAPGELAGHVVDGARAALERIDLGAHDGLHPRVGALDVAPVVFLEPERRGQACAEALVLADRLGDELGLPVYLYGLLAGGRTRAELRNRGTERLEPDFGPREHPTGGAVLVAARPPLIAFNAELAAPATLADAKRIAALIRDGGEEGLPGVRALGLALAARGGVAQVTMNVEDHLRVPLAEVVAAIGRHATITECEVVGLPPRAAFVGFPDDLPVRHRRTLEDALGLT